MKRIYLLILGIAVIYSTAVQATMADFFSSALNTLVSMVESVSHFFSTNGNSFVKELVIKEFPVEKGVKLSLSNKVGPITVIGWDKDLLRAEITKRASTKEELQKIMLVEEVNAEKVHFSTNYDETIMKAEVAYVLHVPFSAVVDALKVGLGPIVVKNLTKGVVAESGSGSITVIESAGPIHATTGMGSIEIALKRGAADPLKLETGMGAIKVKDSEGSVNASTGSGTITVEQKVLTSSTALSLKTGSGAIVVTIPSDANATIQGSFGLGSFMSDFSEVTASSKNKIKGVLGTGNASVELSTGMGSITLKKS